MIYFIPKKNLENNTFKSLNCVVSFIIRVILDSY